MIPGMRHNVRNTWKPATALLIMVGLVHAAEPGTPAAGHSRQTAVTITVDPGDIDLNGPHDRLTLLVHADDARGRRFDATRLAGYHIGDAAVIRVSPQGVVTPLHDGETHIDVRLDSLVERVNVRVSGTQVPPSYHFENDILPILSRFGCNSSGCHGKAEGQNGFKLSVFGFDPAADWTALVTEGRGRRVFPAVPDRSLLLLKAAGGMPHGGGARIDRQSSDYTILRDWIAAGVPKGSADAPRVVSLRITPSERQMQMGDAQQLRVMATDSAGRTLDVTHHARFQSNNEGLAGVSPEGLVTAGHVPGEAAIMASYMGAVDVFRTLIPAAPQQLASPRPPVLNFIDRHVDAKLAKLNIVPSGLCSDGDFLRRASLDIIGTLPTAAETRKFLADTRPDKRARLVDELLQRPEYADYWALKWSDLLRVDRQALGHKPAWHYYRWIRDRIADNAPYDEFVRELLTAEGPLSEAPAGRFYKVVIKPGERSSTISQVFLGVRIECAQCHHHPFDRWSQTDYLGMQAYFTQVTFKATAGRDFLIAANNRATKHPRSGETIFAHPLGAENPTESPEGDRRRELATWMTDPENPWFARALVNRLWAHFAGRGLVEPVDDFRSTNPPSNPELLDALADSFIKSGYDVPALIRTITASRTYQLSSTPNATNELDEQNYSRALFKRLDAEVAFDAVCQVTGTTEKFDGLPDGYRAIQLWDSHVPHDFLKLFGRPLRASPCECERSAEPSVSQVLHVMNSPELQSRLGHAGGRVTQLLRDFPQDNAGLVSELYLTLYARHPSDREQAVAVKYLETHQAHRRQAAEDLMWTMMNTVEFLFNH